MILAIFCTRYRDMGPVVQSVVTLCFFITPIIWTSEQLPKGRKEFVDYNIFYYFMEMLRKTINGNCTRCNYMVLHNNNLYYYVDGLNLSVD
ncbi:ABC transporter permease [Salmonella sp. NCTC 11881]|nr:ABC transporter permease [Salmonella sp. NCTC 11881]